MGDFDSERAYAGSPNIADEFVEARRSAFRRKLVQAPAVKICTARFDFGENAGLVRFTSQDNIVEQEIKLCHGLILAENTWWRQLPSNFHILKSNIK